MQPSDGGKSHRRVLFPIRRSEFDLEINFCWGEINKNKIKIMQFLKISPGNFTQVFVRTYYLYTFILVNIALFTPLDLFDS